MRGVLGCDHVALTVADLEASAVFYEGLGFAPERRVSFDGPGAERVTGVPGASLRMAFLVLGEFRLELIQFAPPGEQKISALNDLGSAHICLRVNDIERVYSELSARGSQFNSPPYHHPSGVSMTYFGDPDGNILELLEVNGSDAS